MAISLSISLFMPATVNGNITSFMKVLHGFFSRVRRCEGPCVSVFFGVFSDVLCFFFCHLPHTFSVIFIKFIGFVSWYYLGIQLDSLCQLVLHVCIKI